MRHQTILTIMLLGFAITSGCIDTDRKPIEQLSNLLYTNSISKLRPEINKLSGQERCARVFRDTSRDSYHTVERFLQGNPPISARVLKQVEEYRDAEYAAWQHHDAVIGNGDFNLSPAEVEKGSRLSMIAAEKMMAIGSH